jgi:hypothetical protein
MQTAITIILAAFLGMLSAACFVAYFRATAIRKLMICLLGGMTLGGCSIAQLAAPAGIIGGGLEGMLILGAAGAIAGGILGGVSGMIVFALGFVIDKLYSGLNAKR